MLKRIKTRTFVCGLLLCLGTACDLEPEDTELLVIDDDVTFRCDGICWDNKMKNTFLMPDGSIAGVSGRDLTKPMYHNSPNSNYSLRLDRVTVDHNGTEYELVTVGADDTGLYGCTGAGLCFTRADFLNARFEFSRLNVTTGDVVIESMTVDDFNATPIPSYDFIHEISTARPAGSHACEVDEDGSFMATVYEDVDADPVTGDLLSASGGTLFFACHSGAWGKAGLWGYSEYGNGANGGSSLQIHEAASRVVRADYCGDGTTWTQQGTTLILADKVGLRTSFTTPGHATMPTEALWGPDGALCLKQPRLNTVSYSDVFCNGTPLPICSDTDDLSTYPDALFWSKVPF